MDIENSGLELGDALRRLKFEFNELSKDDATSGIRLSVEEVTLELSAVAANKGKASAGIKWYILNAAASGEIASTVTHKINVKLTVIDSKTGKKANIAGKDKE